MASIATSAAKPPDEDLQEVLAFVIGYLEHQLAEMTSATPDEQW